MKHYQVYVDGIWHGDFDSYEAAYSYVNSLGPGYGCDIREMEEYTENDLD